MQSVRNEDHRDTTVFHRFQYRILEQLSTYMRVDYIYMQLDGVKALLFQEHHLQTRDRPRLRFRR